MKNSKTGYVCNDCKIIEFHDKDLARYECPKCHKAMNAEETIEISNKARILFALLALLLGGLILLISRFPDERVGIALMIVGFCFLAIPFFYLFAIISGSIFLGFGGLNWFLKKPELKTLPEWYIKPSLLKELLKELRTVIIIGVVMIAFYLFFKYVTKTI